MSCLKEVDVTNRKVSEERLNGQSVSSVLVSNVCLLSCLSTPKFTRYGIAVRLVISERKRFRQAELRSGCPNGEGSFAASSRA